MNQLRELLIELEEVEQNTVARAANGYITELVEQEGDEFSTTGNSDYDHGYRTGYIDALQFVIGGLEEVIEDE